MKDNDDTILTEKELLMNRIKRHAKELYEKPEVEQPFGL